MYVCTCVCVCVWVGGGACVGACVRARVRACVRARLCANECIYVCVMYHACVMGSPVSLSALFLPPFFSLTEREIPICKGLRAAHIVVYSISDIDC